MVSSRARGGSYNVTKVNKLRILSNAPVRQQDDNSFQNINAFSEKIVRGGALKVASIKNVALMRRQAPKF